MARITKLENRLQADTEGKIKDQLLAQLAAHRSQLLLKVRDPREKNPAYSALLEACEASERIINTLWHRYHAK